METISPEAVGMEALGSPEAVGMDAIESPEVVGVGVSESPEAVGVEALGSPEAVGIEALGSPEAVGVEALGSPEAVGIEALGSPEAVGMEALGSPEAVGMEALGSHEVEDIKLSGNARALIKELGMLFGISRIPRTTAAETYYHYQEDLYERGKDEPDFEAWAKKAKAEGYDVYLPEILDDMREPVDYREMKQADFLEVLDLADAIRAVDGNRKRFLSCEKQLMVKEIAGLLEKRAAEVGEVKSGPGPDVSGLEMHAEIARLVWVLDGGEPGPWQEYFLSPMVKAEEEEIRLRGEADERLKKLFGVYSDNERDRWRIEKVEVPGAGRIDKARRLGAALNAGNEIGRMKVMEGEGWNEAAFMAVLNSLDKRDWEFVRAVWKYLDGFADRVFGLEEELTGVRPKKVSALPVPTRHGVYGGGFYPLIYERVEGGGKRIWGANSFAAAMSGRGQAEEGASGQGRLLLDPSAVLNFVYGLIHDLCFRKAMMDVAKPAGRKKVREAAERRAGKEAWREIKLWLKGLAESRRSSVFAFERAAKWDRKGPALMIFRCISHE